MLIDTHCHLHFEDFDADREEVIQRAREVGVKVLINVGTDFASNEASWKIAGQHDFIYHTAGLHPHHAHEVPPDYMQSLESFVTEKKPVAIGEIGLDYFKSEADVETQKKVFTQMLELAQKNQLPVIVHSRNAFQDTMMLLKKNLPSNPRKGVMHCFSYGVDELRQLLDLGCLASFTGNITFKNAKSLLEAATFIPLDRVMLETDSPYLAPQSHRGKRNEPAHLVSTAHVLAAARNISLEALAEATTQNALRFFKIEASHV